MKRPVFLFLSGLLMASGIVDGQEAAGAAGHRLGKGDLLDIRVFRHEDLSGKFKVAADGTVILQFIGPVAVAELTPEQARQRIEQLLADGWLRKPEVTVNIAEFAKITVTIDGEVKRAAALSVPRNKVFTVSQAIGMAGGFSTRANPKAVILRRGNRSQTINVKAIHEDQAPDVALQDGDLLVVKESRL